MAIPQTRYEIFCHPLLLIVAATLNLPAVAFGTMGVIIRCDFFSGWLLWNSCLAAMNMVAAVYCVYKIRKTAAATEVEEDDEVETESVVVLGSDAGKEEYETTSNHDDPEQTNRRSDRAGEEEPGYSEPSCFSRLIHLRTISSDRIRHLLCYDGVMATYSILFLFWVFWISEGTQRLRQVDDVEEGELEGCSDAHEHYMVISLSCGFAYISFVVLSLFASLSSR